MEIQKCVVGYVMTNCYIVSDEVTKDAIVIDPGDNAEKILAAIQSKNLNVKAVLLTHGHFDHILAARTVASAYSVKVFCHEAEKDLAADPVQNVGRMFGCDYAMIPDEAFKEGDTLTFGSLSCKVLHTPGHTKGGVCFYFEKEQVLFSGDTLFMESVGRTDFPTGNPQLLLEQIREKLFVLPDEVKVYSGHGDVTTIGYEKRNNPFINEEGFLY